MATNGVSGDAEIAESKVVNRGLDFVVDVAGADLLLALVGVLEERAEWDPHGDLAVNLELIKDVFYSADDRFYRAVPFCRQCFLVDCLVSDSILLVFQMESGSGATSEELL